MSDLKVNGAGDGNGALRLPPGMQLDPDLGRLSAAERVARGKAARTAVPRERQAEFDRPSGRPEPVALLEDQAQSRLPELVPIRYGRMLASPFAYFRGAALPMASDLATAPTSGLVVQACGDAHLSNFGVFATPERKFLFSVNDFDETLPGPWEWDVKRLAASLEIAARENAFSRAQRRQVVTGAARRYREAMRTFAGMRNLDLWYIRADLDLVRKEFLPQMSELSRKRLAQALSKAHTRDSMLAFSKLCGEIDGQVRIIADPPLIMPLTHLLPGEEERTDFQRQVDELFEQYRRTLQGDRQFLLQRYRIADMARKVVGVGSVGTRCWIFLFQNPEGTDPLFLQLKEAQQSVLAPFCGSSRYANHGQRVVEGQRLIQAASDIFLGWARAEKWLDGRPHDFYIRQLWDWKFSLDIEVMKPTGMQIYGELCAWTLARSHARSGDAIAMAAYLGGATVFEEAIADFAAAYADQNETDYETLNTAALTGRIIAHRGL